MPSSTPSSPPSTTTKSVHRRGLLGLLAILLCATAIGAVNLAALQMVSARLGSYAPAALVVGAFALGNAAGLVVQGRLIDRFSPPRVLYPATALFCATLSTAALWHSTQHIVYLALFFLAGLSLPAVTGVVRATVPGMYPQRLHLRLYSAIAVTFQAGMAVGPMAAVAFSSLRESGYAFFVIAGFAATATLCLARLPHPSNPAPHSPTSSRAVPGPSRPPTPAHDDRPLLTQGYITVLLGTVGFGVSIGVVTVGLPAVLDATSPGLVGTAFSALALGDLAAGVVYGSRNWPGTLRKHLLASLLCAALAATLLASLISWPMLAVLGMFLLGAMGTPAGIAMSALLDTTVPRSKLTVAFTTMVATNLIAVSVGNTAGGVIIDVATASSALFLAPLALITASLTVAGRRNSLPAASSRRE